MAPLSACFRPRCAGTRAQRLSLQEPPPWGREDAPSRRRRQTGSRHGACPEAAGCGAVRSLGFPSRRLELEAGWESAERRGGGGKVGALGLQTSPCMRAAPWGRGCMLNAPQGLLTGLLTQAKPPGGPMLPIPRGSPQVTPRRTSCHPHKQIHKPSRSSRDPWSGPVISSLPSPWPLPLPSPRPGIHFQVLAVGGTCCFCSRFLPLPGGSEDDLSEVCVG